MAPDLLKLALRIARRKPYYLEGSNISPNGQADALISEINFYYPTDQMDLERLLAGETPTGFDIETFFSYLAASSAFVENTGKQWNEHGDKIAAFLKTWLAEAIWLRQIEALGSVPTFYEQFLELTPHSLIISFNWDTVVESLMDRAGLKYAFDLHSTYRASCTPLLKLHGSIDWFRKPQDFVRKEWMSFAPIGDNFKDCGRAEGDLLRYYEHFLTPWIVTPGYDKISQILKLGDMWQTPWIYLQDDVEIVVIGFSMRSDDFHTRALLYPQLVHNSRSGLIKSVKVIDFARERAHQEEIKARYAGVKNCSFFFEGFSSAALSFLEET